MASKFFAAIFHSDRAKIERLHREVVQSGNRAIAGARALTEAIERRTTPSQSVVVSVRHANGKDH